MIIKNPWNSPVFSYPELSSTMDVARELISRGAEHGTAVLCGYQSKGRGRGPGRSWVSRSGEAMLASIILKTVSLPSRPAASLVAAYVCYTALSQLLQGSATNKNARLQIKWPNDLMLDGQKLGGILCEHSSREWLICGIGINVAGCPDNSELSGLDEKLRTPAVSLSGAGVHLSPQELLQDILCSFYATELVVNNALAEDIQNCLYALNSRAEAVFPDASVLKGVFRGIDGDGAALLETVHRTEKIVNADICYLS